MRSLGLKSAAEWRDYCKSGKKPADIPANPNQNIRGSWLGWMGDWLGTGTVATRLRQYRSFKKARAFVRRLGLKSEAEWRDYCKSGKKPDDIPANPNRRIREGWLGRNGRLARDRHGRHALTSISTFQESPRVRARPRFEISEPNGATIVSQARSPTTFRLIPIRLTRKLVGLAWAIGSGLARSRRAYVSIDLSRKPALSCAASV